MSPRPGRRTLGRVTRARDDLAARARDRMTAGFDWYCALSAQERSWVGLVVQSGISQFVDWLRDPEAVAPSTIAVFASAPRELTRRLSLRQTLDLARTVVEVVEDRVDVLAQPGDEHLLREAVLRYSREIAFAAAEVYASAAEVRGAWDARLEALVVDAVLRGEADESIQSRAAALGWGHVGDVAVVVGSVGGDSPTEVLDQLRRAARRSGLDMLATIQRERLIVILGSAPDADATLATLLDHFGDGPLVIGPTVPHLFAAGRSARAALSGYDAAPAWVGAPRPVHAADLLAERALAGDWPARHDLVARVCRTLDTPATAALLETATAYLTHGRALEATARALFVHVNTVRYRLGRVLEVTGYDLTDPRDAFVVQVGLALGRLGNVHGPARAASL